MKRVCRDCAICAQFRPFKQARKKLGQPPYSLVPGHTVYVDLVGPLPDVMSEKDRKTLAYVQSMVDSATRWYMAHPVSSTDSAGAIEGLEAWVKARGKMSVLVTDNGPTYSSQEISEWCERNSVEHVFIAPYSHQSLGLVEKNEQDCCRQTTKVCQGQKRQLGLPSRNGRRSHELGCASYHRIHCV